jgi:hypothetical protein
MKFVPKPVPVPPALKFPGGSQEWFAVLDGTGRTVALCYFETDAEVVRARHASEIVTVERKP